jgi:hypothetical protein
MTQRNTRWLAAAAAALALAAAPGVAQAGERLGDAALGALAGGVVLGPVGAIAGGAVGYTAGPGIAHSWGLHHHRRYVQHPRRREAER